VEGEDEFADVVTGAQVGAFQGEGEGGEEAGEGEAEVGPGMGRGETVDPAQEAGGECAAEGPSTRAGGASAVGVGCRGVHGRHPVVRGRQRESGAFTGSGTKLAIEGAAEVDHFDGGEGGFGALVAHFGAGALDGLLEVFDGENAEDDGNRAGGGDGGDALGGFAGDELIVVGAAADDAAEADDGVKAAGGGEAGGDAGDFESAGDADDEGVLVVRAVADEGVEGALEEFFGDEAVEARDDESGADAVGLEVALDRTNHVGSFPDLFRIGRPSFPDPLRVRYLAASDPGVSAFRIRQGYGGQVGLNPRLFSVVPAVGETIHRIVSPLRGGERRGGAPYPETFPLRKVYNSSLPSRTLSAAPEEKTRRLFAVDGADIDLRVVSVFEFAEEVAEAVRLVSR
jgi:hypothetical protein